MLTKKAIAIFINLLILFSIKPVFSQTKPISTFQTFKLGMNFTEIKKQEPRITKGEYSVFCNEVNLNSKPYLTMNELLTGIPDITLDKFCLIRNTKSGDRVFINLGFHKNSLKYIEVIYEKKQSYQSFLDGIKSIYGNEKHQRVKKEPIKNIEFKSVEWEKGNFKMLFEYKTDLTCNINSRLLIFDKSYFLSLKKEAAQKQKSKVE